VRGWSKEQKWDLVCKLENDIRCNPFDYLPPELSLHLLSFLNQKDLARAAQVCWQWHSLACDKALWASKLQKNCIYCQNCNTYLASDSHIIERKYRLDFSLAYNISKMCEANLVLAGAEKVMYSTGEFHVAKASCKKCKVDIGVKYISAASAENEHKVGTFLVKKKMLQFPGEPLHQITLACKKCRTTVAKEQDIINWNLRLRGFQAYQFTSMQNIYLVEPEEIQFTSGRYTVSETFCSTCKETLGVKYIEAPSGANAYKIGTYLIEKPKLKVLSFAGQKPNGLPQQAAPNSTDDDPSRRKSGFLTAFLSFLKKK